jgi:E3 Ubiquitin ligase.
MGLFGDDDTAQRRDAVRATAPTRATAVSPGADLVAVEGVVRVHEKTLTVPLADAEVAEMPTDSGPDTTSRRQGDSGDGDEPPATDGGTTLDRRAADRTADDRGPAVVTTYVKRPRGSTAPARRRVEAVPFVVEDESGRVLVDATDAPAEAVLVSPGHTERLLGDESGSRLVHTADTSRDTTREIARARTAPGTTPDWEHERGALRVGDGVYVLGRPRSSGEPDGPATAVAANGDAPFVLSDLSRSALAEQLDRRAGGLDRRFWLFAVVGGIAAFVLLITVAVFLDSFVLSVPG